VYFLFILNVNKSCILLDIFVNKSFHYS